MGTAQLSVATCVQLRSELFDRIYGHRNREMRAVPETLLADLYPLDFAFLCRYVEDLLASVGNFDALAAIDKPRRYRRFLRWYRGERESYSGFDGTALTCESLLAYRFDHYDTVSAWSRKLGNTSNAITPIISRRLGLALTILTIPAELDEAYLTGPYVEMNQYGRDPMVTFTEMVHWFFDFLDTYTMLAKHRH